MVCKLGAFCRFATDLGDLSTCKRLKVGCVIIPADLTEVLAIGYNGPPSGRPNDGCRQDTPGGCGCVHAEANALVKLRDRRDDLVVITTKSPCEHCAGLILNSRTVGAVIFRTRYREGVGIDLLEASGIPILEAPELFQTGRNGWEGGNPGSEGETG